jgi:SAM-dependent methyltransferase
VRRFPRAGVIGVDNSAEMLDRARRDIAGVSWVLADVAQYRAPEAVDLLFANALLQWLPDHARLFPALFEQVRVGGALAVQMPINFEEPSHRLMRETEPDACTGFASWVERLRDVRELNRVATPEFYYDIWQTNYQHVMADANAIVEWVKGAARLLGRAARSRARALLGALHGWHRARISGARRREAFVQVPAPLRRRNALAQRPKVPFAPMVIHSWSALLSRLPLRLAAGPLVDRLEYCPSERLTKGPTVNALAA